MPHRDQRRIEQALAQRAGADPHQERKLARRVLEMLNASPQPVPPPTSPIQASQVHPPSSADMVVPLMAPSRWLVLPESPVVPAGTDSAGIRLEFSAGGGWLIGWRGVAVDTGPPGVADVFTQAQLGVQITLNDGENLITNGVAADFCSMASLFAPAQQVSPIMRRVDVKDVLIARFRNFNAPATGISITPRLCFFFWRQRYPGTGNDWQG